MRVHWVCGCLKIGLRVKMCMGAPRGILLHANVPGMNSTDASARTHTCARAPTRKHTHTKHTDTHSYLCIGTTSCGCCLAASHGPALCLLLCRIRCILANPLFSLPFVPLQCLLRAGLSSLGRIHTCALALSCGAQFAVVMRDGGQAAAPRPCDAGAAARVAWE